MAEKQFLDQTGVETLLTLIKEEYVSRAEFEYVEPQITSFTNNKNTVEKGTTITEITFNWKCNKEMKTIMLDAESITPTSLTTKTLSGQNITTNKTWTLKVTDEKGAVASKTTSVTFLNGVYYGTTTAPEEYNNDFLLTLTKNLQANKVKTFTDTAQEGEYFFYAVPSSYGAVSFNVGGFDGGFTKVSTFNFQNASGFSENYDVYKSDNPSLGKQTITCK